MHYTAALAEVRNAKNVARNGWPVGQYVYRDPTNPAVPGDRGYLTLKQANTIPTQEWEPTSSDREADDWIVVA
jgi:hypothetical protein